MVKAVPLGGVGEIGLNMMALECEDHILVIDAGLMFPGEYLPGVDLVIPDFQYLRENRVKVKSLFLTHGHEDHIGAVPFFLKEFPVPVYGTGFTLELLREKLKEHRAIEQAELRKIRAGEVSSLGPFEVEAIAVNHSIVEGVGLAVVTPEGILVHSGDFKVDATPVDRYPTDLVRFAHYGEQGVLALFSDSTNAEKDGFTPSEAEVRRTLEDLFAAASGRIIVAVFASHIARIQQVVHLAARYGRKVLFNGKSMITNVAIAKQEGLLRIPQETEIREREMDRLPERELVVLTTGSQGEPMSALSRMAHGDHRTIRIKRGDTIILSSRFIPGNERAITGVINNLYRLGADVVYEKIKEIHTSGHAYRGELKLMLSLVKPRYFIPIHGELRHLIRHMQIARDMGLDEDRLLLAENGTVIRFEGGQASTDQKVHSGRVLVDGKGVGDVGEMILRDRRRLSEHGIVMVLLAVDEQTGETIYGPDIVSRGFVFETQQGFILEDAKCIVLEILDELERRAPIDWQAVEQDVERRLKRFFYSVIERRPFVLPVILPI